MKEKITKGEIFLLGLTAVFLILLLCLARQDRRAGLTVETAVSVPQEEIVPDISLLDLNAATAEELEQLPGIGPALAERIIAYRETEGPFSETEELLQVPGIGEGKFSALEGWITVQKGTTQ